MSHIAVVVGSLRRDSWNRRLLHAEPLAFARVPKRGRKRRRVFFFPPQIGSFSALPPSAEEMMRTQLQMAARTGVRSLHAASVAHKHG